jgi:hypothetical protein
VEASFGNPAFNLVGERIPQDLSGQNKFIQELQQPQTNTNFFFFFILLQLQEKECFDTP